MKKTILLNVLLSSLLILFCSKQADNPFFSDYDTPFETPPFEEIKEAHYMPAFMEGIKQQQQDIDAIVNNPENPSFENTIEALDNSGDLLKKVKGVFYNIKSACTNEAIQGIAKEVTPILSQHEDEILLNDTLFLRVKTVYNEKDKLNLSVEQNTLLETYYKDFIRGGANLESVQKAELTEINKELSLLSLQFGENVLKENNAFEQVIENEKDLAGLP